MVSATRTLFVTSAVLAGVAALAACPKPTPQREAFVANETWCPDGFEIGPQDTCFAIPDTPSADTPILVYLHGPYQGHGNPEEWSLVRGATQRGFAVVMPRGKRGACAWTAEVRDNFCWPREPEDRRAIKATVAEWEKVLWQVEALLEGGAHPRFVLGNGNGGFFAAHLATHGYFDAAAWAVLHGGALAPSPRGGEPTSPIVMVSIPSDAESHGKMIELRDQLRRANWPHEFCTRPGAPALAAADLDIALRAFKRISEGRRPDPPEGSACEVGGAFAQGGPKNLRRDGGAPRAADGGAPRPSRDGGAPRPKEPTPPAQKPPPAQK